VEEKQGDWRKLKDRDELKNQHWRYVGVGGGGGQPSRKVKCTNTEPEGKEKAHDGREFNRRNSRSLCGGVTQATQTERSRIKKRAAHLDELPDTVTSKGKTCKEEGLSVERNGS